MKNPKIRRALSSIFLAVGILLATGCVTDAQFNATTAGLTAALDQARESTKERIRELAKEKVEATLYLYWITAL